jgi:hypothetical protein
MSSKKADKITVDEKHQQMTEHFLFLMKEKKPELQKEVETLIAKCKKKEYSTNQEYQQMKKNIKELKKEIYDIDKTAKNYFATNARYAFDYFEQKKESNKPENKTINIFDLLSKKETNKNSLIQSKNNATMNYWKNLKNFQVNMNDYVVPTDICETCGVGELITQDDEGILICNNKSCCACFDYLDVNLKPQNKDVVNEITHVAYIRKIHWKEFLLQFQGKETTNIPPKIIKKINERIDQMRLVRSQVNWEQMRGILIMLKLNSYVEHVNYILMITCGIKPPEIDNELNEILCHAFQEIEIPWIESCPEDRTNFFHRHYVFYQLCVLLDQTQYLPYITLLKDREKQIKQDLIWKKVCKKLGWLYVPSVP